VLSKLFSKKSPLTDSEQLLVTQSLDGFRSAAFPQGILSLINDFTCHQSGNKVNISFSLPFAATSELATIADNLSVLLGKPIVFKCSVNVSAVRVHNIKQIKNIVAIASGKGGVGKSTTTVNIARALQKEGAKVGILDADIYGPSIPTMLGCESEKPGSIDGKFMMPIMSDGIASMSIGYLVPESDAAVWRGPMASSAFNQLLNETAWPELDYLLIDMPPGTGDIQLTLSQKVPVAGAVIVTTPQDIALADAQKGIAMFDKVKVPVLGVIENMSYHQCQHCGHQDYLFGVDGGKDIAEINHVALLGQLPLHIEIRQDADLGDNLFKSTTTSDICDQYRKIARNIASQIYYSLDMNSPMTPTVVESNE